MQEIRERKIAHIRGPLDAMTKAELFEDYSIKARSGTSGVHMNKSWTKKEMVQAVAGALVGEMEQWLASRTRVAADESLSDFPVSDEVIATPMAPCGR